jgi:hypothetical protein
VAWAEAVGAWRLLRTGHAATDKNFGLEPENLSARISPIRLPSCEPSRSLILKEGHPMTTTPKTHTLQAANDNPGGATHVEIPLAAFVTLIAEAYVARAEQKEHKA